MCDSVRDLTGCLFCRSLVSLCSTLPSCSTNRPSPLCPPAPPPTCRPPLTPSSPASRDCEWLAAEPRRGRSSKLLFSTAALLPLRSCSLFFYNPSICSTAVSSGSHIAERRGRLGRLCRYSYTFFSPLSFSLTLFISDSSPLFTHPLVTRPVYSCWVPLTR